MPDYSDSSSTRLPPWPDELLDPARRLEAVAWAATMDAPPRRRAYWLQRWSAYTGEPVTPAELNAARGGTYRPGG